MAAEDSERVVTELLAALRKVERILAARTLELKDEPGWSDVTSALEVTEVHEGPDVRLGFFGYVDAEKDGVGSYGWVFDVLRQGRGWTVDRSLDLNANTTSYDEAVVELPMAMCTDTQDLARRLPGLIEELLAVPVRD